MQTTILSTADVARLFDVTETTVKRWADEGTLKCQRTPGGHRKFAIRYVIEFAERNHFDPVGAIDLMRETRFSPPLQAAVLSRDFPALAREYTSRAMAADEESLLAFFSYLYEHKVALWEIHDLVLRGGMQEIGERWMRGELGVEEEHRASARTVDALARLQTQVFVKPSRGKSSLLACLGEDLHEIGLRCVSCIFEAEGWGVHYLGARTPRNAIIAAARKVAPDVLAVSVSMGDRPESVRSDIGEISAAAREVGAQLVVGGRGAMAAFTEQGGADEILTSSRDLLEYLRRVEKSNGPGIHETNIRNGTVEE